MPYNNQSDTEELGDDIKEGSSRAEITRTFKKMFKNKKSNKKMHNSFIETVAYPIILVSHNPLERGFFIAIVYT